jgi:transcriptional regulator with XRE-family HTH domain
LDTLGKRLEHARRRRAWTQADLAEKADLSVITVTRLENDNGGDNPRASTIRQLAKALDVDPGWLLFGGENEPPKTTAQISPGRLMPYPTCS